MSPPPSPLKHITHHLHKAYSILDSQNAKYITALGNVCGAIQQLPTSAVLSAGLEKCAIIALKPAGLMDIWYGYPGGFPVAIKAHRIYRASNLEEAKEVSKQPACEVRLQTRFTDPLEVGAGVDEIIPSKHPTVPWRRHDALSAFPRL